MTQKNAPSSLFAALQHALRKLWTRVVPKPVAAEASCERLPSGELQRFLVDQLQFVVYTIASDFKVHLESAPIPAAMHAGLNWHEHELDALLAAVTDLSAGEIEALKFQLKLSFGMDVMQWNISSLSLPRDAQLKGHSGRYVRLSYVPALVAGKLQGVRLIVQDISEIKQTEERANAQRREMEKFFALLQVSDHLFELFMSETRRLFEEIKSDLRQLRNAPVEQTREYATRLFRAVHTIKANARLFHLESIQDVAHKVESYLDDLRQGLIKVTPETWQELTQRMQLISEEVYSYASLRKEMLSSSDRNSGASLKYRVQWVRSLMSQFAILSADPNFEKDQLDMVQKEFSRALSTFDRASLKEYVRGYEGMIQEIGGQLGKDVSLRTELDFHQFDSLTLSRVNDILLHCLRNAVDHGIESPDLRQSTGKSRQGTITLSTVERNGMVEVTLKDDGRGIDVDKVRARAVELGILREEEARVMQDEDIVPLLFNVGVSTATTVSEISGRGLGMDVVRDAIYGMNGQLKLSFVKGQSTTVSFLLPAASEDYMAPLAIHDIRDLIEEALRESKREAPLNVIFETGLLGQTTVFADRKVLLEALTLSFLEMGPRIKQGRSILVSLEEHLGKRKVDSFVFYRLKIGDPSENRSLEAKERPFDRATELIRKCGGSLYIRSRSGIEINVPSNIPVPFADYTFKVLIFSPRSKALEHQIDHFFKNVMGGWHYKIYCISETAKTLPPELNSAACLVLLDSRKLAHYVELRSEKDRMRDGIILYSHEDLDIDGLNESAIVPENLLFAPPAFDEKHLHRCLVSIIFRRFLKEMVREKNEAAAQISIAS